MAIVFPDYICVPLAGVHLQGGIGGQVANSDCGGKH